MLQISSSESVSYTHLDVYKRQDIYHIKAGIGEYSENDIAIEGACYEGTEEITQLLEKHD